MRRANSWLMLLHILKWVFFAQGVIFGVLALGFAVRTVLFLERSTLTTGTVTVLEEHQEDEGASTFSPVFTFVNRGGRMQMAHSNSSSNPSGFEVGEAVPVRYETADPSVARIATYWQMWAFETAFAIGSCVTWLLGLFFRWREIQRLSRAPKYGRIGSLEEV